MIAHCPKPYFMPVALSNCILNCAHCRGIYLHQMVRAHSENELLAFCEGFEGHGMLISGGFDRNGRLINLKDMLPALRLLRERFFIAIHPGFVDEGVAEEIASSCHMAFVDIPVDEAISPVLRLSASTDDYIHTMETLLDAGVKVSPHITVGLYHGEVLEWEVFDRIKHHPYEKLVVNVVVPTARTPFEKVYADPQRVLAFVEEVQRFGRPYAIGCMRPRTLDRSLIDSGVTEMANPSRDALAYAETKGIRVRVLHWCCGVPEKEIAAWDVTADRRGVQRISP